MKSTMDKLAKLLRFDDSVRFELLLRLARWLVPGYRFKWPQMAWWDDPEFSAYLEAFDGPNGLNADRRWMLGQLLRLTAGVAGDTAECGVYRGAGSLQICRFNRTKGTPVPMHFVFDSFEGLSAPEADDGSHWRAGDLSVPEARVARALEGHEAVRLLKGWIPERFAEVADRRFAFVHVDVDLLAPTRDSVSFFYPRLNDGGILLCDDYGFTSCPGATRAIDDYLTDKPEKMIALSGGGGFLIKGCVSAAAAPCTAGADSR